MPSFSASSDYFRLHFQVGYSALAHDLDLAVATVIRGWQQLASVSPVVSSREYLSCFASLALPPGRSGKE